MNSMSNEMLSFRFGNAIEGSESLKELVRDLERRGLKSDIALETVQAESKAADSLLIGMTLFISVSRVLGPQVLQAIELWMRRPGSPEVVLTKRDEAGKETTITISGRHITPGDFRQMVVSFSEESVV